MKLTLTLFGSLLLTLFIPNPLHSEISCYYDYIAPVAICDAHTVVSLSNDGTARVYATDIDDGSYDNCHIDEYKVRRMVQGWCPPGVVDDTQFRPYVEFCCEDVGQTIWVMRVVDEHGLWNECMAEVTVQDNSTPHFQCPPNITVSCNYHFDDDDLYNPYNNTFGNCNSNGNGCESIIINDPWNNTCNQPFNWGCDGYAGGGGCGGNVWVNICDVIDYRNSCGEGSSSASSVLKWDITQIIVIRQLRSKTFPIHISKLYGHMITSLMHASILLMNWILKNFLHLTTSQPSRAMEDIIPALTLPMLTKISCLRFQMEHVRKS